MQMKFLIVALSVFLTACATPAPLQSPLQQTGSSWIEYYKSGDLDGLMTLYTEDAVVALHAQPMFRGIPEIREYFSQSIGKTGVSFDLEYELVEMNGDIAHAMAKYWLISKAPDSDEVVYQDAGRSLLIYKKARDGRWKIAVDIDQATPDVQFPVP